MHVSHTHVHPCVNEIHARLCVSKQPCCLMDRQSSILVLAQHQHRSSTSDHQAAEVRVADAPCEMERRNTLLVGRSGIRSVVRP